MASIVSLRKPGSCNLPLLITPLENLRKLRGFRKISLQRFDLGTYGKPRKPER
jgi:hypothetical protein